ncbi:MAG: tetratricopeptide repeat protein, partial [Pseudomonadota bacterium]
MATSPEAKDTRAAFDEAIGLIAAGKTDAALAVCSAALERDANDVTMLALHGAVALKMGDLATAERDLRGAVRLAPNFAKPHEDLGLLLLETGRADKAVAVLKTATQL